MPTRCRLLVLMHRFPYPPNRGDRIRSYNILRELSRNFQVSLGCTADEPVSDQDRQHVSGICEAICVAPLSKFGRLKSAVLSCIRGRSLTEGMFHSNVLQRQVADWQNERPFDAVFVFCSSMFPYVSNPLFEHVHSVVDLVDADSAKWKQMGNDTRSLKKWIYRFEARRVRSLEQRVANRADAITLISKEEVELFREIVDVSRPLAAVGNGVDTEYFQPAWAELRSLAAGVEGTVDSVPAARADGSPVQPTQDDEIKLVFTGVLDYWPNVEGVRWFCQQVMPVLRKQTPATLAIVGRRPDDRVLELDAIEGVEVVGEVDDVRPYLSNADISVSPLQLARGIQNKVLEAMAMGKPVVASPEAAKGIEAEPNVELMVAESVQQWVDTIGQLAGRPLLRTQIGEAARKAVLDRYSWSSRLEPMSELISGTPRLSFDSLHGGDDETRHSGPIRVGFVMHKMQVAGAEVLVQQIIHRLKDAIEPTVFCLDGLGELGQQLRDEGTAVVVLDRQPGMDKNVVGRLAKEIKSRRIQVLHAHQYTPFFYSALAKLRHRLPCKILFTEHGRHYPDLVSWKRRWANRLVLQRLASLTTACCDFSTIALQRIEGFPKAFTLRNGVDLADLPPRGTASEHEHLRAELGLDLHRPYAACIARFHSVKDHRTLVSGWAIVHSRVPEARLLLIGDGPERESIESLADELGLRECVEFWGIRSDVGRILRCVDVFTLTSVSEAASLTLLEAMASQCASVVTDVGGNAEHLREGLDGFLVPRGDSDRLADRLSELLQDHEKCARFGKFAREHVVERFDLARVVDLYFKYYQQLARHDHQETRVNHAPSSTMPIDDSNGETTLSGAEVAKSK